MLYQPYTPDFIAHMLIFPAHISVIEYQQNLLIVSLELDGSGDILTIGQQEHCSGNGSRRCKSDVVSLVAIPPFKRSESKQKVKAGTVANAVINAGTQSKQIYKESDF